MMSVKQLKEELEKMPDNLPVKLDTEGKKYRAKELDAVKFEGNYVLLESV